ncbi:ribonuclease H-like domain-containing protein [Tanacetum coccineum]
MLTPSPSPPISLSPPSAGECLARCTASSAHSSPPPVAPPLLPSSGCLTQIQTLRIASTQALVDAVTAALPPPPLSPLPPSLYLPPPVDRRDYILEFEQPPHKRSCLFALGSRYEIGESSTARPTGGQGVDYGFVSTVDAEARRQGISEVGYGIRDTWVDPAEAVPKITPLSTPVSTASTNNSTACLSDATVYAYLATQPNGSQVVHEDLDQIHEDDLDEMDLKWQLALLSMKARKFYQRTGKKIVINGSDTAGYDKKKVECFNCHKLGHFARECRNPKSQENRSRSQDSSRRTVNVEESSSKAMLAIDGTGFDWSYMAQEEASTNFALMAFSDSEVQNNKTCSKTCLKNFEDLKSKYDKLRVELTKSESDLYNYKRGLASVEEKLVFYKKNERLLCDQIAVLKRDASFNESDINGLKKQVERIKKEKEDNQFKIENFENASKSLDQLIGNQISGNNKKGLGYNTVPPPLTGLFAPLSIDLSNSGLENFKEPEFEGYGVKVNKGASENVFNEVKKTSDAPIIEDWVSNSDKDETVVNFAPTAVLTKSGLVPFSTARQSFSRTTAPVSAARDTWVDPAEAVLEISPITVGEVNTRVTELAELHERDTHDLYALLEDAQDGRTRISQRVAMDSQRVDLLMGDRMTLQETVWIVEEEAYASREAWAHSIGFSQAVHHELQTHRDHVYAYETHIQAYQAHLQLQSTLIQTPH